MTLTPERLAALREDHRRGNEPGWDDVGQLLDAADDRARVREALREIRGEILLGIATTDGGTLESLESLVRRIDAALATAPAAWRKT